MAKRSERTNEENKRHTSLCQMRSEEVIKTTLSASCHTYVCHWSSNQWCNNHKRDVKREREENIGDVFLPLSIVSFLEENGLCMFNRSKWQHVRRIRKIGRRIWTNDLHYTRDLLDRTGKIKYETIDDQLLALRRGRMQSYTSLYSSLFPSLPYPLIPSPSSTTMPSLSMLHGSLDRFTGNEDCFSVSQLKRIFPRISFRFPLFAQTTSIPHGVYQRTVADIGEMFRQNTLSRCDDTRETGALHEPLRSTRSGMVQESSRQASEKATESTAGHSVERSDGH